MSTPLPPDYGYDTAEHNCSHAYLLPVVYKALEDLDARTLFDLGCGNGSVANQFHKKGYSVAGVDYSAT